jgi:hypothetical protein
VPGWFPHPPDQSQYNRRQLRALLGLISDQGTVTQANTIAVEPAREPLLHDRPARPPSGRRWSHPNRQRTVDNLVRERALASTRLVIESVFSNLKEQMRLEHRLARTAAGLVIGIAQPDSHQASRRNRWGLLST